MDYYFLWIVRLYLDKTFHFKFRPEAITLKWLENYPYFRQGDRSRLPFFKTIVGSLNIANSLFRLQLNDLSATGYVGGLHNDDTMGWQKEIRHTRGRTEKRAASHITKSILNRRTGWQVINNDNPLDIETGLKIGSACG